MTAPEALPAPELGHTEPRSLPLPREHPELVLPRVLWVCRVRAASGCLSADHTPFVPHGCRGNLFTRTLSDIVSKDDFVLDSEYLVTLLVIVPK